MRKIERHLIYRGGRVQNKSAADGKKWDDLKLKLKDGSILRETIEIIGDREIWRDTERDHHFGFLRDFIDHAAEVFSNSLQGRTLDEKVDSLHFTMKDLYCIERPELRTVRKNELTGEERTEVFSVSRGSCTLDDDTLARFYEWTRSTLHAAHIERYGYDILTEY